MNIEALLPSYQDYLQHERAFAPATLRVYTRDLLELARSCPADVAVITIDDLRRYQRDAYDFVFPDLYGGQWCPPTLATAFHIHLKNCGLEGKGITPHSLRHTFATRLIRQGVSLVDVQTLLGHVDIKSTMQYIHCGSDHLRAAVDRPLYPSQETIQ